MSPSRTRALRDAMRYRAREADAWLPKMRAAYKRVIERQWEEAIEAIGGGEGPAVALARLHDVWVRRAYEDTVELVAVGTVAGYKLTEKVETGITGKAALEGWTSIIIVVLLLGGVQLITLGLIGEYIARIYMEAKRRPLYIIDESLGLDDEE